MRRSERLTEIIDIVRDGRLHTAHALADALGVTERTIYRDMLTLMASGVPVEGERGVGYMLRDAVFLPPLVLSLAELEALSLGMSIVREVADDELEQAAKTLHEKIAGYAPNRRKSPESWGFGLYEFKRLRDGLRFMATVRHAIRDRSFLRITYTNLSNQCSERTIRPLQTDFWGKVWTLSAWCEMRQQFRAFRVDRIVSCKPTGRTFKDEPGKTIADYLKHVQANLDPD